MWDKDNIFSTLEYFLQKAEDVCGPGTGEQKKKAVLDAVTKLLDGIPSLKSKLPTWILNNLSTIIDVLVFFYNALQAFKSPKPTVTP